MNGYKTLREICEEHGCHENTARRYFKVLEKVGIEPVRLDNTKTLYYAPQQIQIFKNMWLHFKEEREENRNPKLISYLDVLRESNHQVKSVEVEVVDVSYREMSESQTEEIEYEIVPPQIQVSLSEETLKERDRKVTEWFQNSEGWAAYGVVSLAAKTGNYGFTYQELWELLEVEPAEQFYWNSFIFLKRKTDCDRWYPRQLDLKLVP